MRYAFGRALRDLRRAHGLTQEDFAAVSSRTYLSALERGKKSPTLDKIHNLAGAIGVHLLSVLTVAFLYAQDDDDLDGLLDQVRNEVTDLLNQEAP
ncbi:MAG TPA: helix-turn-helix transcriptional regulator [Rhodocyclaceae bacterium]|nr:helix-turn-helix transcriptional regulator [Rhodocyclaceae bacterium]